MGHNQHIDPNEVFPSIHKSLYFIKEVALAGNIDSKTLQSSERFSARKGQALWRKSIPNTFQNDIFDTQLFDKDNMVQKQW